MLDTFWTSFGDAAFPQEMANGACERQMTRGVFFAFFTVSAILCVGCEKAPSLIAYRDPGYRMNEEAAPIVVAGQIVRHTNIGHAHPSPWYPDEPMQMSRVTIRVENALRGQISEKIVQVYYLISLRRGGHVRMGMVGHGGHWQIGGRAIFFLRRDSGVLRTIYDTWASATPTVLTGAHPNYKAQPGESIPDSVIDILLDRGEGCDDAQWAHAISVSTAKAQFFDLAYTVRKLRQIMATHIPDAREAAEKELDELSYSWPKIRQGWPETEKNAKQ